MTNKEVVLVRVSSLQGIEELAEDIRDNNIECSLKLLDRRIYLKKLILRCIVIPIGHRHIHYIKGLRSRVCFGFDEDATSYLTRCNNVFEMDKLMGYILENNK